MEKQQLLLRVISLSGGEFTYTMEMFEEYIDTWMEAAQSEAVLVHCTVGYRAGILPVLCRHSVQN